MALVIWSLPGSPPWQSAQVTPACPWALVCHSAATCACLSFTALWQSKQPFAPAAAAGWTTGGGSGGAVASGPSSTGAGVSNSHPASDGPGVGTAGADADGLGDAVASPDALGLSASAENAIAHQARPTTARVAPRRSTRRERPGMVEHPVFVHLS